MRGGEIETKLGEAWQRQWNFTTIINFRRKIISENILQIRLFAEKICQIVWDTGLTQTHRPTKVRFEIPWE